MWMMQVLPKLKECLYMRKPSLLNDVKLDDVQNIEVTFSIYCRLYTGAVFQVEFQVRVAKVSCIFK